MNSSNIKLTYNGEEHTLTEWADISGNPVSSIRARYNKSAKALDGETWSAEQIIYGKAGAKVRNASDTSNLVSPGKSDKVANLLGIINDYILESISAIGVDEVYDDIMPKVKEKFVAEFGFIPEIHKVETPEFETKFEGTTHEVFDEVLQLVYNNIPIYLTGSAGVGKNVICKQVAQALKLDFYFTNAVTQEYKLTGFIDANGLFHDTQFFNAFTKGGLFFLDEMDASIPEVLVILNAAIANRYFDFPGHGRVEAHKDFRVIAAGNTLGTGADVNYTGRYSLDKASLDRFAIIHVDYSKKIEMGISHNNEELVLFAHAFRDAAIKASIQCLFSYRSIERITTLEPILKSLNRVLDISLVKGLGKDDITIICDNISKSGKIKPDNKYLKALKTFTT